MSAIQHDDLCSTKLKETDNYIHWYCGTQYSAVVTENKQRYTFYGESMHEFRGLVIFDFLTVSEAGYVLSHALGGALFTHSGTCAQSD